MMLVKNDQADRMEERRREVCGGRLLNAGWRIANNLDENYVWVPHVLPVGLAAGAAAGVTRWEREQPTSNFCLSPSVIVP